MAEQLGPRVNFLKKYYPVALSCQQAYGIPAGYLLALAAHESGWGRSMLAMQHNNFFGIKARGLSGTLMPTKEYLRGSWQTVNARFETYASPEGSFKHAAKLLSQSAYYTRARRRLLRNDVVGFIREVSHVWATDPQHAEKVLHIMNQYKLWEPSWLRKEKDDGIQLREKDEPKSQEDARK